MFMNYLGGLLKSVDYSSVNYYFHIDGGESFRTKFGGFLYICYFMFFMSFTIKLSTEFFFKTNYNIIPINKILPSPPELPLRDYNLSFAFSVTFENNSIVSEEILKKYIIEKAYFVTLINSTKKTKREIKLRPCQKNDLYTKFNNPDLNYSDFINLSCLDDRNFTLQGAFNDQIFQYIEYGIYLNYTSYINEKMTNVNNFYGNNLIKVIVKYFEMGIDVDNYANPLRTYEFNIFKYVSLSKISKANLDFSLHELQNNDQALFGNPDSTFFLKLGENFGYDYDMFERNPSLIDYNVLLKYYVRSSSNITIVKRTYQKLWDLLASIAGLAGQVLFCIVFINTYYNKFKSKEVLVNNLLKFKENYNISKLKLNELMRLQDDYINIIEIEKLQNQNFNRGSTARTFKSRSNYENFSGFHEINKFEFNDEQQLFINNQEQKKEKRLNENIIRKKRLSYAQNVYQNEIYGELERSSNNKNYSDNNEKNIDKNNNDGPSNGIEKLLWIKRLSSAPNKDSNSYTLRKFNSNRQSHRAHNLNIIKKGERAKSQKRSVGFVEGSPNKFNLPNFDDNEEFEDEYEEDSKPRNLKVDTLDSYFSAPQNKEKSNLEMENTDLDPNPQTEAPKVVFMNKNLNVLRNSIFNNQSRLIMRKLLSAKNNEKLSNILIKEENTNENISSRYIGQRPEDDSINKKGIKNDSNQLYHSSENRVRTEDNIGTGNPQALRNSQNENIQNNESNIDSFNSLSVDDENNEQPARGKVLNELTTRTNYDQYNNNIININNNNQINNNHIELSNFQKFKEINSKKFSFNALDKLIIESGKLDKDIVKKNDDFDIPDEDKKINELTLKENKLPVKQENDNDSNGLEIDENNIPIKILDKEVKEINKAYINIYNNNIDKSDNVYYKTNDNMIDKNLNDLKKQKEGVKLSIIESEKYSNKLSNLKPNVFSNDKFNNQKAQTSPETMNQDDRINLNFDIHSERHDLTKTNKLNLNLKSDSQENKYKKKLPTSKYRDSKLTKKVFFKFSIFDIFCQCFCKLCKSKANQYQLYKRSYKSINNHLNIYFYLKLIQEMDIFKSLVFSLEQIGLINFVSKPMICDEVNSQIKLNSCQIKEIFSEESNLENAIDFYKGIINKKNLTEIDHKLIKIFHYEFETIMDNQMKFD